MDVLSRPADEFANDALIEELWAQKAFEHANVHFKLLCSVNPRELHLTLQDDSIYKAFREHFPKLNVREVNEDEIKSANGKTKWREFIKQFETVEDFSYGTLLRLNSCKEFSCENSILVIRLQFLAIEIARNREGHNDEIRKKFASK